MCLFAGKLENYIKGAHSQSFIHRFKFTLNALIPSHDQLSKLQKSQPNHESKLQMANLRFAKPHNNAAELEDTEQNRQFHQVLRFLRNSYIAFALTTNPNIYETPVREFWRTAEASEENGEAIIRARVSGRRVSVTERSIRLQLRLNDEAGVSSYPNQTILENLDRMGYERQDNFLTFQKAFFSPQWKYLIHVIQTCISKKRSSWNEFNLTHASALVALATGEVFNFSKMIFTDMLSNIANPATKFLMYPRFLQIILEHTLGDAVGLSVLS